MRVAVSVLNTDDTQFVDLSSGADIVYNQVIDTHTTDNTDWTDTGS
jgi:hypothetical protein